MIFYFVLSIFSNSGNHTVVMLDYLDWFINHVIFSLLLYISLSLTNLEKIGIFWRFSWSSYSFLFFYFYNISITKSSLLHLNVPFYVIFFLFNWYSTFSYCSKNINVIERWKTKSRKEEVRGHLQIMIIFLKEQRKATVKTSRSSKRIYFRTSGNWHVKTVSSLYVKNNQIGNQMRGKSYSLILARKLTTTKGNFDFNWETWKRSWINSNIYFVLC